jgi:NitT/TauT family transport system substrate-binding protein
MRRHLIALTAVPLALALGLAGCAGQDQQSAEQSGTPSSGGAQSGGGADDVTIGLTYIPNVQFSPVYVAQEDGIYASEGIDTTIRHHGTDEGLFTALAAGEEDVVLASGDEVLQARDQGLDLVSISAYYQSYPVTIIVPEDSPITSTGDLEGRRIGVPGEYGSTWLGLLAALDAASLTDQDVTVVSIGYTQQAALAGGEVDAVVGFTNNDLVQFQQAGMAVRTIDLDPDTTPLVGASLISTRSWLDAHPDEARAVVAGTVAGIQRVVDDPDHAVEATEAYDDTLSGAEALNGARAVLAATTPLFTDADGAVAGEQDLDRWKAMGSFLTGIPGMLSSAPDMDAAVTNDYVQVP